MKTAEISLSARRFALLTLALILAGCGSLRRQQPLIDTSQDVRILREVEARIAGEAALDATTIRVTVEGAIVSLHGSVVGIDAWNCALRHVQLVEGVRTVVEYLTIERGSSGSPCQARREAARTMAHNVPPLSEHR